LSAFDDLLLLETVSADDLLFLDSVSVADLRPRQPSMPAFANARPS
jgi:hypothetical protein